MQKKRKKVPFVRERDNQTVSTNICTSNDSNKLKEETKNSSQYFLYMYQEGKHSIAVFALIYTSNNALL